MEKLTGEFLASCKRDRGRILRGEATTRLETFVDAAFAFAFTMLVISIDQIPRSPEELIQLSKDIPSFVLSALPIGSVWIAHSSWSRIFGLQDRFSVFFKLAFGGACSCFCLSNEIDRSNYCRVFLSHI